MTVAGVPVGREIPDLTPERGPFDAPPGQDGDDGYGRDGSIIIVAATDAPLLPHQLNRFIRRTTLALGRVGSIASNGSGDIFIAFSTANEEAPTTSAASPPLETSPTTTSIPSSKEWCRPPRRPSSTPWWRAGTWSVQTAAKSMGYHTIGFVTSSASTTG